MGNTVAVKMTGNEYAEYRAKALKEGANPKTLNNRLGYLPFVLNVLRHLGDLTMPIPSPAYALFAFRKRSCPT